MKCYNCKNEIPGGSDFCPFCSIYISESKEMQHQEKKEYVLRIKGDCEKEFLLDFSRKDWILIGGEDKKGCHQERKFSLDIDLTEQGSPFVSGIHGVFLRKRELLYFVDLSRNGTILNHRILQREKAFLFREGDRVSFAGVKAEIVKK